MKKCRKLYSLLIFTVMMLTAAFMTVTSSAAGIYSVALDDLDECLTPEEEASLLGIMQQTADKIECNVGLCITADLEGKSQHSYSENFSYKNFGRGKRSVVLVLINTHDKPEYRDVVDDIFADAGVSDTFNTDTIERKIFPRVYKGLDNSSAKSVGTPKSYVYKTCSSAQYYQAGVEYCKALEIVSDPFSNIFVVLGDYIAENSMSLVLAIIISIIFALICAGKTKKSYSKKKPISASNYIDRKETRVIRQVDQFVREYTTSYRISSSSGGRSGGGRSGGGGGSHGGGRHR